MKQLATTAMAAALTVGASMPVSAQTIPLADRVAIVDAITSIAAGADRHDWPRVRAAFADEVTLDYTSLWGGAPATQEADAIIDQWSSFLPGFDETLHLVTNHTITGFDGSNATAEADFQAAHRIGEEMWVLSGHYSYDLTKAGNDWTVSGLMMAWTHETGDRGLVARAAERAGAD